MSPLAKQPWVDGWRDRLSPIEAAYTTYLAREQGLAEATIVPRVFEIHRFLRKKFGTRRIVPKKIVARDIYQWISERAAQMRPTSAKGVTVALRSFCRFLLLRGDIAVDLAEAVPAVAHWRLSELPKFISAAEVRKILRQCDQRTAVGLRNYAVLLLLARLGLRSSEVAAMTLDDINWEAGEILVRGKGLRRDQLPLPHDVGRALARYLQRARPQCSTRGVFISMTKPFHALNSCGVYGVVAQAIHRAKLSPPTRGPHLLRHSLATDLLRRGATMPEIGQLLRHRHMQTTALYAKVDFTALRPLALPWPRVRR